MRHTHAHQFTSLVGNIAGAGGGGPNTLSFIKGWTGYESCGISKCPAVAPELIDNYSFDCGTVAWRITPDYPGVLTDNKNGSVTLQAIGVYASIEPVVLPVTETGKNYIVETEVLNVAGNCKISVNVGGTWTTTTFTTDGVYTHPFTGSNQEIVVGADNDGTVSFDCTYISVKEVI